MMKITSQATCNIGLRIVTTPVCSATASASVSSRQSTTVRNTSVFIVFHCAVCRLESTAGFPIGSS